ncbi:hypothetical protein ACM01_41055 [Streptomyces viridochromogenes]|uniref:ATP-binding protein n=1 Tax=Streptomyces viridochromogenes TaxID=1938 RepID=A0A0J7YW94_STRVR|nr:ATP-binding protein [Streptomyces viridochromogenes]KMS67921.1 hypothetical protein ACM01_41055 [Streptomyces viridochromogenes]
MSLPTPRQWEGFADEARRARTKRSAEPVTPVAAPIGEPATGRQWLDDVTHAQAWEFVEQGSEQRTQALKEQCAGTVGRLAELYDRSRTVLADDPWQDPDLGGRITRRTNFLLHHLRRHQRGVLAPAEASLLALLPFLHQTHRTITAAGLSHVDPTNLEDPAKDSPERLAYGMLLRAHKRLVRQAMRGDTLPDRADGRREIGWWLFHQWAKRQPGDPRALLAAADGEDGKDIATVLDPRLLPRLLSCAHMAPRKLYEEGRTATLRGEPFQLDFSGRDWQQVREWLVGPLFAIAHALAIEVTELPPAAVRHVGIPDPLDLGRLFTTVRDASWTVHRDVLGLNATCDHPAAVAALSEQAQLVDTLLRGARRARLAGEVGALPVYAHADEVHEKHEAGDGVGPGKPGEVIRFRLDEERVQELLMGENLYRDRSLAIRELYQNALDACRYRRARQHARDGRDTYQGEITFIQDFDASEGRHYLECADDGIGMDETVLADVFSRAGVRFTDLARYQEEQQDWERQGITVHPNSRFGIGVLSYFMIADEIRVTTCPMDGGDNGRLEELTVLITGPGHYFRVRKTDRPTGRVGTRVRLYLRDEGKAPSCVRELRRLLGIAEFRTVARHGSQEAKWDPGVLQPREAPTGRVDGHVAHGHTVAWPEEGYGSDGQVIWCEKGGGVLVDGIYTESRVRRGVLTDPGSNRRPRGIVVNLTGGTRPRDLSVDRTEILDDDVCRPVERLVRDALPTLLSADPPLLDGRWLAAVAGHSPRLADIVTEVAGEAGVQLELHGHPAPVATVGFLPVDANLVHRADSGIPESDGASGGMPGGEVYGSPDGATLLWRLLAHRPNAELSTLTEMVPELSRVKAVLAARPSDFLLRTVASGRWNTRRWAGREEDAATVRPGHALAVAEACGMSYEAALSRLERLRLPHPGRPRDAVIVDPTGVELLGGRVGGGWFDVAHPVPPGHLLKAALVLNIGVDEAVERMRAFGFTLPPEQDMPNETPEEWVLSLLSRNMNAATPWLDLDKPVTAGHILRGVVRLGRSFPEVVARLQDYGYRPALGSLDSSSVRELLRHGSEWGWGEEEFAYLSAGEAVPPGLVARASLVSGTPLPDVSRRVEELGFATGPLPEAVHTTDPAILGGYYGGTDWYEVDEEVELPVLLHASQSTGLSPREVASRLRAYGVLPPDADFPGHAVPGDGEVLQHVCFSLPEEVKLLRERPVPVLAVIRAAENLRMSPQAVADRLARYGLHTVPATLPAKASRYDTELLSHRTGHGSLWLVWDKPVPLHHLVSVPHTLMMERDEAIARLKALGLRVPEQALDGLDPTDRRLCVEEHEQGGDRMHLPLSLGHPIRDFLSIVRFAGLPLDELLPRLTRLGVELPRVAEAVRAALPHVPGLVMAPEEASTR